MAQRLLKPGGILVYSTCTFTIEENEGLVEWAMDKYNDSLTVENLFCNKEYNIQGDSKLKALQNLGMPGINLCQTLHEEHLENLQAVRRFGFPPAKNKETNDFGDANSDTIGFFVAKFQKKIKL